MSAPTLHLTNWSSPKLHGPGLRWRIMLNPRRWERGDGEVTALVPLGPAMRLLPALIEQRRRGGVVDPALVAEYRRLLEEGWEGQLTPLNHLRPGALFAAGPPNGGRWVADGDTLLCACAKGADCHRRWAAPFLVRAGWRVILDGVEVTP